jgi:predicted  nucleic acid-binding Zn-ribbon protein
MKCLAKSGFADKFAFLEFTVEIISEIFALILSSSDENDSISEEIRELDEKYEKLTVELNKHKEELIKCETEEKLTEAENIKILISELQLEIDQLNEKINSNTFSQSSQSSQKSLPSFVVIFRSYIVINE